MKLTRSIYGAVLACLLTINVFAKVQDPSIYAAPGEVTNAALVYWQSFALMPKLDDAQIKRLDKVDDPSDLSQDVAQMIQDAGTSLSLLDAIEPELDCRWELINKGMMTSLPHVSKARTLAKLSTADALDAIARGNSDAASKRTMQTLLIARNLDGGGIVQQLASEIVEHRLIEAIGPQLDKMPSGMAKAIWKQIERLPVRRTMSDAIEGELYLYRCWLDDAFRSDDDSLPEKLQRLAEIQHAESPVEYIMMDSPKERLADWMQTEEWIQELAEVAKLPSDEITAAVESFRDRIRDANSESPNLVSYLLLPNTEVLLRSAKSSVEWAEFLEGLKEASQRK